MRQAASSHIVPLCFVYASSSNLWYGLSSFIRPEIINICKLRILDIHDFISDMVPLQHVKNKTVSLKVANSVVHI